MSFALEHCEVVQIGDLLTLYRQLESQASAEAIIAAKLGKPKAALATEMLESGEDPVAELRHKLEALVSASKEPSKGGPIPFFPSHPFYDVSLQKRYPLLQSFLSDPLETGVTSRETSV